MKASTILYLVAIVMLLTTQCACGHSDDKLTNAYEWGYHDASMAKTQQLLDAFDRGYEVGQDIATTESYRAGLDRGWQLGYDEGYWKGYEVGEGEGYCNGYSVGYDAGYDSGRDLGYDSGYFDGHMVGFHEASASYESIAADNYYQGYVDGYRDANTS